ncbi:MAG: 7-cyano-7-deazaguanine synthase QueC [bacterium]|nr:7-cyano-7-deazaguanine synthase QueC [bacterium]
MMNKAVILLSGGLDSAVSLAKSKQDCDIVLALLFNYGQKSYLYEKQAAENLCKHYGVKLKIIDLDWLKNISNCSLVNKDADIPTIEKNDLDNLEIASDTMKNVWIPNRNSLFLNIAAAYCDSFKYDSIIIGANKEEAATFADNSSDFIEKINGVFEYSTLAKPKVIAPLISMTKEDIIKLGYELNLPFQLIRSCYSESKNHCGKCESCMRLKRGLERLGLFDILNMLFVE